MEKQLGYATVWLRFQTYIRGTERGLQTIEENDKIEVQNTEQTKCRPQKLLRKGKERIIMGAEIWRKGNILAKLDKE